MSKACNLQELQNDPLGILRPASKLQHNLHLASAYAAVYDARDTSAAQQKQKRRMDPKYHEPKVHVICTQHGSSFPEHQIVCTLELVCMCILDLCLGPCLACSSICCPYTVCL